MKRVVIRERTIIPPFGESARDLRILNKPLWLLQRDLLAVYCQGAIEIESLSDLSGEREELLVCRDNLFFNDLLIDTFITQARSSGQACQIAFARDDKMITTHALHLQDGITLSLQHNVYVADLYYYPQGITEAAQPLVIDTEPREMGYYHIPRYMAPNQGDLLYQVPKRAFLSVENWVHVVLANSPLGVFSWGRIVEELAITSWREKIATGLSVLWDKFNPFAPSWRNHFLSTSRHVKVGKNCSIDPSAVIYGPTVIGDNVTIGAGVVITNSLIGKNVTIMQGCQIMLSVISDRCFLPFNAALFMSTLMENSIVAQNSTLQLCVIGRNTFIGANNCFTDFNLTNKPLQTLHQRKGAAQPRLEEIGLPVIGSAVGHNCKMGSGFIVYPARMIGSNTTLIFGTEGSVIARNVGSMASGDDQEFDDYGEAVRAVYKWPQLLETDGLPNQNENIS